MPDTRSNTSMSLFDQAFAAHKQGDTGLAKQLYARILEKNPDHVIALHNYGLIISEEEQLDGERALAMMKRSLELKPEVAAFHHNIGGLYSRMGMIEKAVFHFSKAIKLKPDYTEPYQGLTASISCKGRTDLLKQIEHQLSRKDRSFSPIEKSHLHFAAGKICADCKMHDKAFEHYLKGNAAREIKYDPARHMRSMEQIMQVFDRDFAEKTKEWGLYDHTPIFVLGMPRSGSTLTEQILSSHSSVYGAGELSDILLLLQALEQKAQKPYPFCVPQTPHISLLGFAIEYIMRMKQLSNNAPRVVNKSPINFKHVGFLLLLFPNAKIIHTMRDPIDTCLSCFFQNFTDHQHHSFNLEHLADFYNGYRKIMNHWDTLYPGRIFHLHYEKMIEEQEKTTRDLLAFCELPWEDGCLSFHKTERDVATASKFQVRQPLYKKSIKRWKQYEKQLQPLISRLEYTE